MTVSFLFKEYSEKPMHPFKFGIYHVGISFGVQYLCLTCAKLIIRTYFSTKTYVVGTQKNRLNETVILRTQNIC